MYTELKVNLGDASINGSQLNLYTDLYMVNKHKLKLPKVNFTKCVYMSHICDNCPPGVKFGKKAWKGYTWYSATMTSYPPGLEHSSFVNT